MNKIGVNLFAKGGLAFEPYAQKLKELGVDATFLGWVDKPETVVAYANKLAALGISFESMHAPFNKINDLWMPGETGAAMLAVYKDCVDRCALGGVPILVMHLSAGANPPFTDAGRDNVARLVEYAAQKNVKLAFENVRCFGNVAWLLDEYRNCDTVGFCWDVGHQHCFTMIYEYMPLFGRQLLCTHIHDNHCVYDHDEHLLPFEGTIDWAKMTGQMRESGYTGTVMLEVLAGCSHVYDEMSCETYLEKAAAAVTKLRDMMNAPADK